MSPTMIPTGRIKRPYTGMLRISKNYPDDLTMRMQDDLIQYTIMRLHPNVRIFETVASTSAFHFDVSSNTITITPRLSDLCRKVYREETGRTGNGKAQAVDGLYLMYQKIMHYARTHTDQRVCVLFNITSNFRLGHALLWVVNPARNTFTLLDSETTRGEVMSPAIALVSFMHNLFQPYHETIRFNTPMELDFAFPQANEELYAPLHTFHATNLHGACVAWRYFFIELMAINPHSDPVYLVADFIDWMRGSPMRNKYTEFILEYIKRLVYLSKLPTPMDTEHANMFNTYELKSGKQKAYSTPVPYNKLGPDVFTV